MPSKTSKEVTPTKFFQWVELTQVQSLVIHSQLAWIYTRETLFQCLAGKQGKFMGDNQHERGTKTRLSYPSIKNPYLTTNATETIQASL